MFTQVKARLHGYSVLLLYVTLSILCFRLPTVAPSDQDVTNLHMQIVEQFLCIYSVHR